MENVVADQRIKVNTNEYRKIHYWAETRLGKPMKCHKCGNIDRKRYHWANISGKYKKEITDWIRVCVKCHCKMDHWMEKRFKTRPLMTHCKKGHELTKENTYTRPQGWRECRICKRNNFRIFIKTKKEEL